MTNRPSFERIYMDLAHAIAERSTCKRLHVGCVITSTCFRHVYGVGYNGGAAGVSHDYEYNMCYGTPGTCGCLHAEMNAVTNCDAPRCADKFVFVTHFPCIMCAKGLINMGWVKTVYYGAEYRNMDAAAGLFDRAGIYMRSI